MVGFHQPIQLLRIRSTLLARHDCESKIELPEVLPNLLLAQIFLPHPLHLKKHLGQNKLCRHDDAILLRALLNGLAPNQQPNDVDWAHEQYLLRPESQLTRDGFPLESLTHRHQEPSAHVAIKRLQKDC